MDRPVLYLFDYDDTIFPSSNIQQWHSFPKDLITNLENIILNLFTQCQASGQVWVVTNANTGWVHNSCYIFMPRLHERLFHQSGSISLVSAREKYQAHLQTLVDQSTVAEWKLFTFHDIIESFRQVGGREVITIGDSDYEHNALRRILSNPMNQKLCGKTIRMVPCPTASMLWMQLQHVQENLSAWRQVPHPINVQLSVAGPVNQGGFWLCSCDTALSVTSVTEPSVNTETLVSETLASEPLVSEPLVIIDILSDSSFSTHLSGTEYDCLEQPLLLTNESECPSNNLGESHQ